MSKGKWAVVLATMLVATVGCALPRGQETTRERQSEAAPIVAPKQWVKVAEWTGKGTKSTERFTVRAPWKIAWDTNPGEYGAMNFQIFIYGEGGIPGVAANVIGADSDESIQHRDGSYYLQFNTAQPYTVVVSEQR